MTEEAVKHPLVSFPQDRTCPYHPPAGYDPLRAARPLTRVRLYDGRAVWLVTGIAAARDLLGDPRLSADQDNEAFPSPTEGFKNRVRGRRLSLLGMDDPEHKTLRRTVIPTFTAKRVSALRPKIQEIVDALIDDIIAQGPPAELVSAFALPVSSQVMCLMLGVPYADHEFFEEQSRRLIAGPTVEDTQRGGEQLDAYLGALIERKQREPGDALLDELIHQPLAEGAIRPDELMALAALLVVAGHETTTNMISLGAFTLLEHPDRLAELRADPELMPAAVEELLRFCAVAEGGMRVATQDIEYAGQTIRANDGVVMSTSLINRDTAAYSAPDELDWHRPDRHHLAFGFGMHQCLGQNLARAEIEIALRTLFDRLPGLKLAAPVSEIPFKPGTTLQGMLQLPVRW
ncbi:cytochrome P450 [Streptomyces sp. MMG1121]|uniref:cytochrome P450 n=1 Tax=Streptomyces sp. MMG1121 TaxID=1415544 RepID=UPI0006AF32AB|nr:cytochrome P450 [Streptomyces sp. MMG1121]KOV57738.1 cytochrome P450 [Streptomyces sp. MMG1121]